MCAEVSPARPGRRKYEDCASQREYISPEQTFIIYDWDDTLCPSCWIQDNHPVLSFFRPPPQEAFFTDPLNRLEQLVLKLLTTSMALGQVVIVTNAQEPWVETSCRYFLPKVMPFLSLVSVVYAHDVYDMLGGDEEEAGGLDSPEGPLSRMVAREEEDEDADEMDSPAGPLFSPGSSSGRTSPGVRIGAPGMYSGGRAVDKAPQPAAFSVGTTASELDPVDYDIAPQRWKEAAFKQVIGQFYSRYEAQSWKNIISVGDATFERDALRHASTARPNRNKRCRVKTVKMLDEPSVEELIKQVKVILDGIGAIVRYDGNLDIEITDEDLDFGMETVDAAIRE